MTMIPDEGQTTERKESMSAGREIVETCAAFATAQGGRIYIGVHDNGEVRGVQIGKGTLEGLANDIAQNTVPRLVPEITTVEKSGRTVIVVDVTQSKTKPVCAYGRAYRRSGRTNQVLSASEIAELYFSSRGVTWDETALEEATIDDIDNQKVERFLGRARAERQWNIDAKTSVPQVLRQLKMMDDGRLTIAAVLLFGKDPQQFLLQSKLRCARFKGTNEASFIDMKVIEGDIVQQVEEAMAFVRRHTSMAVTFEGKLERTEQWEYPLGAVREAVTNAVCHRDYASSSNVTVRIYDDRLEVVNPGCLPAGMTVEDLKRPHESIPRNKLIADAFFLIRYIEQFGTGIGRMIKDCQDQGAPEPAFNCRANSFYTVFPKRMTLEEIRSKVSLSQRQIKGLEHVQTHGHITRKEYERLTAVTVPTAKRDLGDLVEKGLLEQHGKARNITYRLGARVVRRP